jgi:ribosomal protein S27AE
VLLCNDSYCGRCGYKALSSPYEDFEREDGFKGTETHKCPVCGEQWWLATPPTLALPGQEKP